MKLALQMAQQMREVYLSGNWVATNLKTQLESVTVDQAYTKVGDCNTIVSLAYHINYYIVGLTQVLDGGPLDIKDKFSFDHPDLSSSIAWENFKEKMWSDVEHFSSLIEKLTDSDLSHNFVKSEYGNYYRNLAAMIEHTYYHLGQIAILRKLV